MSKKLTTEEFIKKAKKVHGDKYDYSKVVYTVTKEKVTIICPIHGEFRQRPNNHLNGGKCYKCANKKQTTEDFIRKAREVHGDKYDYSKSLYVKSTEKVTIVCTIHGEFEQSPSSHVNNGSGCQKCGIKNQSKPNKLDLSSFIEKAKKIHGDRYDYTETVYTGINDKVTIICSIHGKFQQTPQIHLLGSGCPRCVYKQQTTEDFIFRAILVHSDRYDYAKVQYEKGSTPVPIICPIHGEFYQKPHSHLNGSGCQECAETSRIKSRTLTTDIFLERSVLVHGDTYNYSLVDYKGSRQKIKIICKKHGIFEQDPITHLRGSGCHKCASKKISESQRHTKEQFTEKAKKVHGEIYDYSCTSYVNNSTNIKIICKKHGAFEQLPSNHLSGQGCPLCNQYGGKRQLQTHEQVVENFPWLETMYNYYPSYLNKLEYDIFFPQLNLAIEIDGAQHYRFIKWFHKTEKDFRKAKKRDYKKNRLSKLNNIVLWRYPTTDLDIEEIIEDIEEYIEEHC